MFVEGFSTLFRAKILDAVAWEDVITAISSIVDEASFNTTPDGLNLREMDPSHVAMVEFEWPKSVFDEYVCDEAMKLCVNIREMLRLLRRVRKGGTLELTLAEGKNRLNMRLSDGYLKTFSVPTLEPLSEEVPTPNVTFDVKARVTTSFLRDTIEDASTVSDNIRLEMTKEKLIMRAEGSLGSVSIELEEGSESALGFEVKKEAKATFSLSYLNDIIKAASQSSSVATVEFSTDMPIRLNFELPNKGKLLYYLAPRIEG